MKILNSELSKSRYNELRNSEQIAHCQTKSFTSFYERCTNGSSAKRQHLSETAFGKMASDLCTKITNSVNPKFSEM